MITHAIYKMAVRLFWGGALSVTALSSAVAVTPSTTPLTAGSSAVLPNIMLMLDNSGSMREPSEGRTRYTATTITSLVPTIISVSSPNLITNTANYSCGTTVSSSGGGIISGTGTDASPYIVNMYMNSGTPRICRGTSTAATGTPCNSSNSFSSSRCFDNTKYYRIQQFASSSTRNNASTPFESNSAIYSGQKLNWYFNINPQTVTTTPDPGIDQLQVFSGANLTAANTTKPGSVSTRPSGSSVASAAGTAPNTRVMTVKSAAQVLLNDLKPTINPTTGLENKPKVRMALSVYEGGITDTFNAPHDGSAATPDNDDGGALISIMGDLTTSKANELRNKIGDSFLNTSGAVNYTGFRLHSGTPVGETLADIGRYYTTGETGLLTFPSATPQNLTPAAIFSHDGVTGLKPGNNISSTYAAPIDKWCQESYAIQVTDGEPTGDDSFSTYVSGISVPSSNKWAGVAKALSSMDLRPSLGANQTQNNFVNKVLTYVINVGDATQDTLNPVAVAGGTNQWYSAMNATDLAAAFRSITDEIQSKVGSFSAVVANTSKLDANSAIFQASYDTADWTGNFIALKLNETTGIPDPTPVWQAGQLIPKCKGSTECSANTYRNIFTYNVTNKGVQFKGASASAICALLSPYQKNNLNATGTGDACDTMAQWQLDWLRGDISHEKTDDRGYITSPTSTDPRLTTAISDRVFRNRVRYWRDTSAAVAATAKKAAIPAHTLGHVIQDAWLLGDIVNSDAAYVSDENYGYSKLPDADGGDKYAQFVKDKALRTKMVYVGANDGMLHGFNAAISGANMGKETLAFMPESVFAGFKNLSNPAYSHQYFVDGSPRVGDAYFASDSQWHTVLVGTTGAGGKGVFALDVSTPDTFSASNVLWEISDRDTPNPANVATDSSLTDKADFAANMGYSLPQASIGKLHNGKWAAIVANGYASAGKKAVLYLIEIETGKIIKTLDTLTGGGSLDNGLSTPFATDIDADGIIDVIYAGDLLGNMWKFDVSDESPTKWKVAYGTTSTPAPVFTACNDATSTTTCSTTRQAITNKPQVGRATDAAQAGKGVMVYFGTGKYFEDTDNDNKQIQSFYGVWDECPLVSSIVAPATHSCSTTISTVPKKNLQEQSILKEQAPSGTITASVRLTSNTPVTYAPAPHDSACITAKTCQQGWYIDFKNVNATPTENGERIVSASLLRGGRIIFTTLIPDPAPETGVDSCSPEASSSGWLMELNAISGSRLEPTKPALDINGNGYVGLDDVVKLPDSDNTVPASGIKVESGSSKTPAVFKKNEATEMKCLGSSEAETAQCVAESISAEDDSTQGHLSWRQLP